MKNVFFFASGFEIGPNINYLINLHSFPVFFGQLTSAYEGIGLVSTTTKHINSDMRASRVYQGLTAGLLRHVTNSAAKFT